MTTHVSRTALIALAVLAAFALLGPVWPGARLSVSTGKVEIGRGEPPVWKLASSGEALGAGDRVRTGDDGRAEVVIEGSTVRVYPNSLLRLPEASTTRKMELEKGSSLFDVLHNGEPFEVRTPEVVVSVKGTRFGVQLDGNDAAVSVFRGLVGVHGDGEGMPETLVHAGFAAMGHDHFELSWHGTDDAWDKWDHGGELPRLPHDTRREAALRDAHQLALLSARDLSRDGRPDADGGKGKDKEKGDKGKGPGNGNGGHGHANGHAGPPASVDVDAEIPLPGHGLRDKINNGKGKGKDENGDVVDVLNERIVGSVIENATGGLLTINFIDGSGQSGGDRVQLAANLDTWVFEENQLDDILEGEDSLPANLVAVLDEQGVSDVVLVNQLLTLFRH